MVICVKSFRSLRGELSGRFHLAARALLASENRLSQPQVAREAH